LFSFGDLFQFNQNPVRAPGIHKRDPALVLGFPGLLVDEFGYPGFQETQGFIEVFHPQAKGGELF
jgi:hypothetical protein